MSIRAVEEQFTTIWKQLQVHMCFLGWWTYHRCWTRAQKYSQNCSFIWRVPHNLEETMLLLSFKIKLAVSGWRDKLCVHRTNIHDLSPWIAQEGGAGENRLQKRGEQMLFLIMKPISYLCLWESCAVMEKTKSEVLWFCYLPLSEPG